MSQNTHVRRQDHPRLDFRLSIPHVPLIRVPVPREHV